MKKRNAEGGTRSAEWRKKVVAVFVFSLLYSAFRIPNSALAAFMESAATARSAAMGGSFVAMADDASALTLNPAGLARLQRPEIVGDYSRLYAGLSDGSQLAQCYMGYAQPLRTLGGTLAMGWKDLRADDLYSERTLSLGYARPLLARLQAGAALKQLHHGYEAPGVSVDDNGVIQPGTPDLFAENGTSRDAYALDLGLLYDWTEKTRLGVAVQNLNEPDTALASGDRDPAARVLRVGAATRVRPGLQIAGGLQTQKSLEDRQDWIGSAGAEREWKGGFSARGSLSLGSREFRQISTGMGIEMAALRLDYAFLMNLSGVSFGSTAGTHRFTLTYRLGTDRPAPNALHAPPSPDLVEMSPEFLEELADQLALARNTVGN